MAVALEKWIRSHWILLVAVATVFIVLGLIDVTVSSRQISKVHILAYVGTEYGDVRVTVYLDGELKGSKDVAWGDGPFDMTFSVVPGNHAVRADWSRAIDGRTNETEEFQVGPFSTYQVQFLHGVGTA